MNTCLDAFDSYALNIVLRIPLHLNKCKKTYPNIKELLLKQRRVQAPFKDATTIMSKQSYIT